MDAGQGDRPRCPLKPREGKVGREWQRSSSALASALGTSVQALEELSRQAHTLYNHHSKPKPSGELRQFSTPQERLRLAQVSLKYLFENTFRFRSYVHGGRKKHSVATYVDQHRGRGWVAHVDIRNFYPSVKRSAVVTALQASGCTKEISNLIADLTWLEGYGLPQGASTSTILASAVLMPIYKSLQKLSTAHGLKFDSLNDDLLISADYNFEHVYGQVIQIVKRHGYEISTRKSGIMGPTDAQVVAGRKLNKGEVTPPRGWMRNASAQVEAIIATGPAVVASAAGLSVRALKSKVQGNVGYLGQVNPRLGGILRRKLRAIGWYF